MVGIRYLSKSEQSLFKNFTEILNILIIRFHSLEQEKTELSV